MRNAYNILVGNPEGKDHSEDLGVDGRIILDCVLGKCGKVWNVFVWIRIGTGGGLF
jgi:hypothetical protein